MTEVATRPIAPVTLEGAHVRLEPLSLARLEDLLAAASESRETYGWTWVPDTAAAMREYVEVALDLAAKQQAVPFTTINRATGLVVGSTRFANFEDHGWKPGQAFYRGAGAPDGVEIGWTWLAASAQRTRINSEAKLLMMRHAFSHWGVRVVRLQTDSRNSRSRAAIERLGCQLDGVVRAHKAAADGAIRDSATYSMLESEWPAAEAALMQRLARG
ncbi:MAG: GNAT family protein [bacterium]